MNTSQNTGATMGGSTRREFLATAAALGGAAAVGGALGAAPRRALARASEAETSLKILVLGGTRFVGLHFVEAALDRGHEVTCFTRGRSNPDIFKGRDVEMLVGNRDPEIDEGLSALVGREWDAVFDTTSYVKRLAVAAAETLKGHVGRYVNISSVSAYAEQGKHGLHEDDPVATIDNEDEERITGDSYGPLKAICERTFAEAFGDGATNIRPGFIVGPEDYMQTRFPLWCARVARGGELVAPGEPSDPVQLIDARDLAEFSLRCIEIGVGGTFNAVGPASRLTIEEFVYGMQSVTSAPMTWTWVSADFLDEKGMIPIPWLRPDDPTYGGLGSVRNEKAKAAGMTFRPLARTALDTMAWLEAAPVGEHGQIEAFFAAGTEQAVLDEWKAARSAE